LFYFQNALQTPTTNAELTRRLYSVHAALLQRANGALEDPTALPQRAVKHAVETPSHGVCFEHAQSKRRRMAFYAIAQRFHSVCTALLAFAKRAPLRSAVF